ncbi:nuclear transport factor 2 family protein [Mycolicibacterium sphagni]|uniref:SnoaL-like domain-containing protein n=1 Tax=Mycolicibacterium sphagni TaxID=1786 RepID=A0A255DAA1_9MYCO|nr:nuclear transport factor 2 family protein [Mycolicibacterium sphagni]OYN76194.1 hypothetical protein CG716_22870 [Mycolicibacterium sphagni]
MPEPAANPHQLVADFYSALSAADTETIVHNIETRFVENAVVEWPPSLPHGGRVEGARRRRAVFSASANTDAPAGTRNLELVSAIGDGDEVVARITFDWLQPGKYRPCAQSSVGAVAVLRRSGTGDPSVPLGYRCDLDPAARLT